MDQFINGNNAQKRVVDQQTESQPKEVYGNEAEALLKKYYAQMNKELPTENIDEVTKRPFDSRVDADTNGEYHNTTWSTDGELDLEIKITSTMPLPKR